eukprot:CAMPEP_0184368392 /NCGR_PEP_ID=MMETSP1089-20130417/161631_1 /TAXON_ID=38269 ORGANISM="Gloeochaete wittrockiana, Strain SAG46.84" /NCGR_SAMPLE_ID=MMETSP1089 /ASSEMBLY_ACC=CAM_ASM_000445 /LENGTH=94 /DNA_ID=CAMNT_0026710659 /DNA_START=1447 /DNA_END=1732 /DNA_ORIENTATION=-
MEHRNGALYFNDDGDIKDRRSVLVDLRYVPRSHLSHTLRLSSCAIEDVCKVSPFAVNRVQWAGYSGDDDDLFLWDSVPFRSNDSSASHTAESIS